MTRKNLAPCQDKSRTLTHVPWARRQATSETANTLCLIPNLHPVHSPILQLHPRNQRVRRLHKPFSHPSLLALLPNSILSEITRQTSGEMAQAKEEEYVQNLNVHLICPQCRETPPNIVEEFSAGDIICASCGLVLQSHIVDTRSEWRTFSNDDQNGDDPSRVGDAANPLYEGNQLSTAISYSPDQRSRDLNRAQGKSTNEKTTKQLSAAFKQIDDLCANYQFGSNVADFTKHLYKLTDQSKQFKGKSQDGIIAGCIFIACRHCEVPRTFKEIMHLTKVPKKEIGRTFKLLEKFFPRLEKQEQDQRLRGYEGSE